MQTTRGCRMGARKDQESKRSRVSVGGTYRITHTRTGRSYIGCTRNLVQRFSYHRTMLNRGKHHNAALQRDWSIDGPESFSFEIVARFQNDREVWHRHDDEKSLIRACGPVLSYNLISSAERRSDATGAALKQRVIKLNAEQWEAFDAQGGMEWLRALIDRARPKE